jgi:Family of unknown function (DUF6252)
MKRTFQMLLFALFLASMHSCKSQSGKKQAEVMKSKIDAVMGNYQKPTSKDALYAEAKVDGEKWVASWMFVDPDPGGSFNVNGHNGDKSVISFYIGKTVVREKGSKNFSENNQAQMFDDEHNLLIGKEGAYQITNVNDTWIEGNFHFTAKDEASGKTHQVTDGFFRVPTPAKFKKQG